MRARKVWGRPLLPWWVYVGYFLLGVAAAITSGFDVKPAKGKTKELAKHGRFGDTEVVHVNAMEKAILKAMGGAGSKNPKTGKREYYDASFSGGQEGSGQTGGNIGGASPSSGGNAERDQQERDIESLSDKIGTGELQDLGTVTGGPTTGNGPPGPPPAAPEARGSGLSDIIESVIAANKPSILAPTARMTYELASGLGRFVGEPLDRAFGGRGVAQEAQFDSSGRMGPEGRNDSLAAAVGVQPAVQQAPAFMRPAPQEVPASLGLPQGLSDIQKRTLISTYGTQGAQSQYRTPEAMRAYGNLIARALIGDDNRVTGNETGTLPIEDQYLRQVFGVNQPSNASALLEALRPYWSA